MSSILRVSAERRQRIYSGGLDVSSRTGFLLGAFSSGLSYQPNLLSRGTRDQAIISGARSRPGRAASSRDSSWTRAPPPSDWLSVEPFRHASMSPRAAH